MTADDMKAALCCYWRFVRHYPYVVTESNLGRNRYSLETSDVCAVTQDLYVIEVEIKVSIGDLRREIRKAKYRRTWGPDGSSPVYAFPPKYGGAKYCYFAVPSSLADRAKPVIADLYPGAGLLVVSEPPEGEFDTWRTIPVTVMVKPHVLPDARPLASECVRSSVVLRLVNQMCRSMAQAMNYRMGGGDGAEALADMILSVGREAETAPAWQPEGSEADEVENPFAAPLFEHAGVKV